MVTTKIASNYNNDDYDGDCFLFFPSIHFLHVKYVQAFHCYFYVILYHGVLYIITDIKVTNDRKTKAEEHITLRAIVCIQMILYKCLN